MRNKTVGSKDKMLCSKWMVKSKAPGRRGPNFWSATDMLDSRN